MKHRAQPPAPSRYPWREMDVGDYFDVKQPGRGLNNSASHQNRKSDAWHFIVRKLPDGGQRCMRVW